MHYNINRVIIILILSITIKTYLSTQELTIIIPDKFNNNELLLPPFPKEIINKLEINNYEDQILQNQNTRWVKQNRISYNYYSSILKNNIDKKGHLSHLGQIDTDFETIELLYQGLYQSNFYKVKAELKYDIKNIIYDVNLSYYDYHLPVNLGIETSLNDKNISLYIGQFYYDTSWNIKPGISDGEFNASILYKSNDTLRPYISLMFKDLETNHGTIALGFNQLRLGLSIVDLKPLPYFEYYNIDNVVKIRLKTDITDLVADYNFELGLNKRFYVYTGIGTTIDKEYKNVVPYISAKENLLFGERTYKLSLKEFNFTCSFIKDEFTSIISIDIIEKIPTFGLLINYKVGTI